MGLEALKQKINYSIWCDFIERSFIDEEFGDLIEKNIIYGATSNPSIFANAFKSEAYKPDLEKITSNNTKEIYEKLALADIKKAANKLLPLYEKNNDDGFISIEVDPHLFNDAFGTIEEGARYFDRIGMPNVMIKIPATEAGYTAMQNLTAKGINVNATLVFSKDQAVNSAKAISEGMAKSNKKIKGVISVFVSRFDRELDNFFQAINFDIAKLGIINALDCYYAIEELKNNDIRTLFASTGVKGDNLEPTYYIKNLIYPRTINTAPLNTIKEYIKEDNFIQSKQITKDEIDDYFNRLLNHANIDRKKVALKLLNDGLHAFIDSFNEILANLKNSK